MVNLRLFSALVLITSLGVLASNILAPIEARFLTTLTDDPRLVGFAFGLASIFFAVLSFYLGRLSDRYGRRRFILLGLLIGIIYPLFYASIYSIFLAYGIKMGWAFAAVATGPLLTAYVQDLLHKSKKKGRYLSYMHSAASISGSIGALIGGYTAEQFGFSMPFYVLAGMFAITFIITFFALPKEEQHTEHHDPDTKRSVMETFRFIFSKPPLIFYLIMNTSFGINWGIKPFLWPLVIFGIAGSDLITGSVFATMGLIAFFLLPITGHVADRIGPYYLSFFSIAVLAVTGIGMAFSPDLYWFWIFAGLYTIGEVTNMGHSLILMEQVPSSMRGEVLGLDAIMDRTLNTIAPFIAGFLLLTLSAQQVFLIFMSLFVITLALTVSYYLLRIHSFSKTS